MDGIHDLGAMAGFGAVEAEVDEPTPTAGPRTNSPISSSNDAMIGVALVDAPST